MWGHFRNVFRRAWKDTLGFFQWSIKQLVWPSLFLVGFLFHTLWADKPSGPIEEGMLYVTYTLAPIGAFALLLFIWNLICASYRIERDAHEVTLATLKRVAGRPDVNIQIIQSARTFRLWQAAHILAGTPMQIECVGPSSWYLDIIREKAMKKEIELIGWTEMERMQLSIPGGRFGSLILPNQDSLVRVDLRIARDDVRKIAEDNQVEIPGLTASPTEDERSQLQLPLDTSPENPR